MGIKTKLWLVSMLVLSTSANAALISRAGGLAYYDDVSNLTWLADAGYAKTSGYDADGLMTWDQAMAWVSALDVGGVSGWRLPDTIDVGNDGNTFIGNIYNGVDYGYNITAHSELSNMFFNVLGNTSLYDTSGVLQAGGGLTNTGPFANLFGSNYWSGTEYVLDPVNKAWNFNMGTTTQGNTSKASTFNAWAVQSGDVFAVPVPAAAWLFASGLVGLIAVARRRH